jgi:D-alanyl-D-alanine carboxypeptidase
MPVTKTILMLCFAASVVAGRAQPLNRERLDSLFSAARKNIMGSIAISKNGKLIYRKSIGYSSFNGDKKIPSTEKTKYRIGSISKTFTSTIVFQLVEENRISLATTLDKYFPAYPNSKNITVEQLLSHRSGIPNFNKISSKEHPRTQEQMMQLIASKPSAIRPGTTTVYSNANYLILGYIVEKILHKPFGQVLADRIVSRIGLTDTYFGHAAETQSDECVQYRFKRRWVREPMTDISIPGASGGILSTPTDLARFMDALFGGKLISRASLDKMKTIRDSYGMGLMEFEFHQRKAYGQVGAIDDFESVVAYFPDDSLTVAFCSNGRSVPVEHTIREALDICYDQLCGNRIFISRLNNCHCIKETQ